MFNKLIYFDEGSAIDYLYIKHGGQINHLKEKKEETDEKTVLDAQGQMGFGTGILSNLMPFLKANLEVKGGVEYNKIGESIIRTFVTNTILSDFTNEPDLENSFIKLEGYKLKAYPNSFSYIKMYSPYFSMFKIETLNDMPIIFQKIDEALEKGRGYYELIAEDSEGTKILKFNLKAFRNNYSLVDLTKMDLTYFAVKVGKMNVHDLDPKNEFNVTPNFGSNDIADIIHEEDNIGLDSTSDNNLLDVYDVILAGIQQ
ncbi:DUF6414 family protein [Methanospirillum lacunae]|uniref:Uncharacterized protein n=1 Tax=Methanospirillum lacunae TaxID=668570 RepID=A0A2V2N555_9EURY|nr:DUF6414 family protein [Methanospirillum lacunae]PWR70641.1 hypothetical protein DK846_14725 [Methanospirillum lacunae]